jgi:hypothetical protein
MYVLSQEIPRHIHVQQNRRQHEQMKGRAVPPKHIQLFNCLQHSSTQLKYLCQEQDLCQVLHQQYSTAVDDNHARTEGQQIILHVRERMSNPRQQQEVFNMYHNSTPLPGCLTGAALHEPVQVPVHVPHAPPQTQSV